MSIERLSQSKDAGKRSWWASAPDIPEETRTRESEARLQLKHSDAQRANESRCRNLLEYIAEGFCVAEIVRDRAGKAQDFRSLDVNGAFERLIGLKRDAIIGKTARQFLPAAPHESWIETLGRVAQTGVPERLRECVGPSGRFFSVMAYSSGAGQLACVFEDITERRRSERVRKETKRQVRAILDGSPQACVIQGADLRTKFINRGIEISRVAEAGIPYLPYLKEALATRSRTTLGSAASLSSEVAARQVDRVPIVDDEGEVEVTPPRLAEPQLQESEERFRAVFENANDAIIEIDPEGLGAVVSANPAACRLFGYSEAEFRSLGCYAMLLSDGHVSDCLSERERGGSANGEFLYRRKDGSRFVGEFVGAGFKSSTGASRAIQIIRDVSERKHMEDALRKASLLSRIAGLLLTSENPQEAVEQICRDVMHHLRCEVFVHCLADPREGMLRLKSFAGLPIEAARDIVRLGCGAGGAGCVADGPERFISEGVSASCSDRARIALAKSCVIQAYCCHRLIAGGRLIGTLSFGARARARFTEDDVELMRTVADLVATALERERSRLALSEANAQLLDADRRKNEFLAVLSHELRNPLAPIKNSVYILDRAAPDGDQARRAKVVIDRQVNHLSRLVDDLLDITRVSRNKVTLKREDLDLNDLVFRVTEDQRSLFEQNEVKLIVQLAPGVLSVHADSARLAQAVSNLLQNAAKFTPRGGKTILRVERDDCGRSAVIRVRDTGVGMQRETLVRLFQPFVQADCTLDRSRGGLGLGLALVKGLIELHGGAVSAHSDGLGNGSEFTVRLPLVAGGPAERVQCLMAVRSDRRRVLIIEDNLDAADSLREALELGNHDVEVAYNGADGLAKARVFRPEIVLCDIGLPGISGYEVAQAFRADDGLRRTCLVALSGYALPEDIQRATEAGFERHIAKPPSLQTIEELFSELGQRTLQ